MAATSSALPPVQPKGDTDFGFCFADLGANMTCPIGNVKMQRGNECMANALASCVEITNRVMMTLLGQPVSKEGPFIDIDDLISKYHQIRLTEGKIDRNGYTVDSLLSMIHVFQVDGVNELEKDDSGNHTVGASKLHKVHDWLWLDGNDFVALSSLLADGYPLICGFPVGPRFSYLEYGEIYCPPPNDRAAVDHCAVLVGAHREGRSNWFYFLNSHDTDFCQRTEYKGDGIDCGVGAIETGHFSLNPIQILRFNGRQDIF
uniref:Peptidase C1A papain C-terminal domain-containing protein n=1 Tax=Oryza brachyantha TaxID=4533 RepID=J3LV50_ORYBR